MEEDLEFLKANPYVFKEGCGTASNAQHWIVCWDRYYDFYTAELNFGGIGCRSMSLWEINKEIYDQVGTFEDDDYKSERLIQTGRCLYWAESNKWGPSYERVIDPCVWDFCPWSGTPQWD